MSNDVFTETLDSAAPAIVFEFAGPRADFETISLLSADRCNPSAQASALLMLNRPLSSLGFDLQRCVHCGWRTQNNASRIRENWCYGRSASKRAFASLIPAASAFA
jgi:hypothetical protein